MIVGLLLIGVADVLIAWATMRLATANPTARLPLVWQPHKPPGAVLLYLVTYLLMFVGVRLCEDRARCGHVRTLISAMRDDFDVVVGLSLQVNYL
jgi:hypothetical protein